MSSYEYKYHPYLKYSFRYQYSFREVSSPFLMMLPFPTTSMVSVARRFVSPPHSVNTSSMGLVELILF